MKTIAKDIPAWAIEALDRIAYDQLTAISRTVLMVGLKTWAMGMPQKTSSYAAKNINTTIPEEVLAVINLIDYTAMQPVDIEQARTFLLQNLPLTVPMRPHA